MNPTKGKKKILINAAERGRLIATANAFEKRFDNIKPWPTRNWNYVTVISDPDQRTLYFDEFFQRTAYFYEAFGYSKSMISKNAGTGQAYLAAYSDKSGRWLDGGCTYRLIIPPHVPANNFWSISVYDAATRCLIENDEHRADLSSRNNLLFNSDGSLTIYFSSKKPEGDKNWIQTLEDRHWFAYMRFYAPTKTYFDKSWVMGDIEEVLANNIK